MSRFGLKTNAADAYNFSGRPRLVGNGVMNTYPLACLAKAILEEGAAGAGVLAVRVPAALGSCWFSLDIVPTDEYVPAGVAGVLVALACGAACAQQIPEPLMRMLLSNEVVDAVRALPVPSDEIVDNVHVTPLREAVKDALHDMYVFARRAVTARLAPDEFAAWRVRLLDAVAHVGMLLDAAGDGPLAAPTRAPPPRAPQTQQSGPDAGTTGFNYVSEDKYSFKISLGRTMGVGSFTAAAASAVVAAHTADALCIMTWSCRVNGFKLNFPREVYPAGLLPALPMALTRRPKGQDTPALHELREYVLRALARTVASLVHASYGGASMTTRVRTALATHALRLARELQSEAATIEVELTEMDAVHDWLDAAAMDELRPRAGGPGGVQTAPLAGEVAGGAALLPSSGSSAGALTHDTSALAPPAITAAAGAHAAGLAAAARAVQMMQADAAGAEREPKRSHR
jgi:hypothetical protein